MLKRAYSWNKFINLRKNKIKYKANMKRLIRTLAVLLVVTLSFNAHSQTKNKFGHINSDELLQMMPGIDSVKTKLQIEQQDIQKELQNMQNELNSKFTDYETNKSTMSDLIRQTKEQEIQELDARIQAFAQQAQQQIQKKREELVNPLIEKAQKAINEVAEENGYTYIFDSALGVLIYMNEANDIMPLVKKKLGLE